MSIEQKRALTAMEVRQIMDSIDDSTEVGLRDRALIALILNSVRLSEALEMRVGDVDLGHERLLVPIHKNRFGPRSSKILQCS